MKYHVKENTDSTVVSKETLSNKDGSCYATISQPLSSTSTSQHLDFYDQIVKQDWQSESTNYASVHINNRETNGKTLTINLVAVKTGENNDATTTPVLPVKTDFQPIDSKKEEIDKELYEANTSPLKNANKVLVRPIAFKPVVPSKRDGCSPDRSSFTPISYDDGYSSQGTSRGCSNSVSTSSRGSSDTYYASPIHTTTYQPDFQVIPTPHKQTHTEDEIDYGNLLQNKESEISKLRRTMELNESAIVRVHEQKRIEWENQMKELTEEYHRRLRVQQDHAQDRDSDMRDLIARLEMDNRQLLVDIQQKQVDQDRQQQLHAQVHDLKQRNTDLTQRLSQESSDSDKLRLKNKELETQVKTLQGQLLAGKTEQEKLQERLGINQSDKPDIQSIKIKQLNERLSQQEQQISKDRENFVLEREKWQQEKEKVLQYQKQLQRTYVQMYRRNNELEQQLCRINSRRQARRESLQNNMDRFSLLSVDIESTPESFC